MLVLLLLSSEVSPAGRLAEVIVRGWEWGRVRLMLVMRLSGSSSGGVVISLAWPRWAMCALMAKMERR